MGILNVTPDSFSDGGLFVDLHQALAQATKMVADGATIIDVGGESTRPGATSVSVGEEIQRVVPVIELITDKLDVMVSIDTNKSKVMRAALAAGASMINDVRALRNDGCIDVALEYDVPICLMHAQGEPQTMQQDPQYENVVDDVYAFLSERIEFCLNAGIKQDRLVLDPGFGFGKTLQHNLALADELDKFMSLGCPLLVGVSRKSMFAKILDKKVDDRLFGSLAMTALLLDRGAAIIRTHDVAETMDVVKVVQAIHHRNDGE